MNRTLFETINFFLEFKYEITIERKKNEWMTWMIWYGQTFFSLSLLLSTSHRKKISLKSFNWFIRIEKIFSEILKTNLVPKNRIRRLCKVKKSLPRFFGDSKNAVFISGNNLETKILTNLEQNPIWLNTSTEENSILSQFNYVKRQKKKNFPMNIL